MRLRFLELRQLGNARTCQAGQAIFFGRRFRRQGLQFGDYFVNRGNISAAIFAHVLVIAKLPAKRCGIVLVQEQLDAFLFAARIGRANLRSQLLDFRGKLFLPLRQARIHFVFLLPAERLLSFQVPDRDAFFRQYPLPPTAARR